MLVATHKNVEVNIADEKKQYYISLGYKITDMNGKVIYDPVENTDNVKELKEKLRKRDADIEKLKAELGQAKSQHKEAIENAEKKIASLEMELAKKTSAKK